MFHMLFAFSLLSVFSPLFFILCLATETLYTRKDESKIPKLSFLHFQFCQNGNVKNKLLQACFFLFNKRHCCKGNITLSSCASRLLSTTSVSPTYESRWRTMVPVRLSSPICFSLSFS